MLTFSVNHRIDSIIAEGDVVIERPTTDYGRAWWSEVIFKAIDGRTDDFVNVDAYGYACERNTKMAVGNKEVALLTVEEIDMGMRGVADTVASHIDTDIDAIIESSEITTLAEEFLEVHESLFIDEGVNLFRVIKAACTANKRAINKLRLLVEQHNIGDLVKDVLENPACLKELEGHLA